MLGLPPDPFPALKEIEMTKLITKTASPAFAAGDRVTVSNAATAGEPLTGSIVTIKSGWYVVELDEPIENSKGEETTTVSARVSSLAVLDPADDEQADDQDPDADEQDDEVEEALEEAEEHAGRMAEALRKARQRYVKARRPSGATTAHNGDTIAKELLDYEPLEVAALADRCLALPKGTHAARYDGLNPGQIRMNSGNRIRGAWKRAEKDGDLETLARIKFVLGLDSDEEQLASIEDRGPEGIEDLQPVEQA